MELNRRQALQALAVLPMVGMVGQEKKGVPAKPSILDVKYPIISVSADIGLDNLEIILNHVRNGNTYPIIADFPYQSLNLYISKITEDVKDVMITEHWKSITVCLKEGKQYNNLLSLQHRLIESPYRTASIFDICPYSSINNIHKVIVTHDVSQFTFELKSITYDGCTN